MTASQLFNRRGIDGVSLDDITAELGATKGALYHYLDNKADLVVRCYRRSFDLTERFADAASLPLTPRERGVLQWVAAGKTDRDIAAILGISPRTVHKHLQRVYEKLGVETRTAAVMRAGLWPA